MNMLQHFVFDISILRFFKHFSYAIPSYHFSSLGVQWCIRQASLNFGPNRAVIMARGNYFESPSTNINISFNASKLVWWVGLERVLYSGRPHTIISFAGNQPVFETCPFAKFAQYQVHGEFKWLINCGTLKRARANITIRSCCWLWSQS